MSLDMVPVDTFDHETIGEIQEVHGQWRQPAGREIGQILVSNRVTSSWSGSCKKTISLQNGVPWSLQDSRSSINM